MAPDQAGPRPLDDAEERFWRAFLRAIIVVPRLLDADLDQARHLNLNEYGVLVRLSEADGRQLRMSDLAAQSTLSLSGMTRIVNRLAQAGLVQRVRCEDDGRGLFAVLTDEGFDRLERAYPTHLDSVRRHLFDHLDHLDLGALTEALNQVGTDELPAAC